MTDIVERLRNGTSDGTALRWSVRSVYIEAADEIVRLRRDLEAANYRADNLQADLDKARVEAIEQAAQVVEGYAVAKSPNDAELKPRRYPSQTSIAIAAAIRALSQEEGER